MIDNGDLTDLKLQIDNIMRYYEEGRDFSMDKVNKYLETAYRYLEKYQRNITDTNYTKEWVILWVKN